MILCSSHINRVRHLLHVRSSCKFPSGYGKQEQISTQFFRTDGDGLKGKGLVSHIISTLSMSTEINKSATRAGTQWHLIHAGTKDSKDDRMKYGITFLDLGGELVASSEQTMQDCLFWVDSN